VQAKRQGPCALGHRTTSSQGAFGEAVWRQVPEGKKWKGARAGDTLCFQKMRRCKHPHETDASEQGEESLVDQYFKRIKTLHIAALNDSTREGPMKPGMLKVPSNTDDNTNSNDKANNDKSLPGLDPSDGSSSASSSLIVTKQTSRVPDNTSFNFDNKKNIEPPSFDTVAHNNCEVPFSAKRSQLQARLVCGIFDSASKKTRLNLGFAISFSTNSDTSQFHQGSVAAVLLGADEAPKINSQQETHNGTDNSDLPCTGPKGKVIKSSPREDVGKRKLMLALAQTSVKVLIPRT